STDELGTGYLVPMTQPLRGLIPLLLDGQAAEPMTEGVRLFPATTPDGKPLDDHACAHGRPVPTAGKNAAYDLAYAGD
ncbi:MAG TPA: hypothetical protein VFR22_13635, partial [Nocardioidaceae bacterium]|nr:hypothetical protein [Nocardioidaceae bacterium]